MIKPIARTFALAIALAPAAALAQASGGYIGAPLPSVLVARNACDGAQGAPPIEQPRVVRTRHRNARPQTVSRSCCLAGMCAEGGGF
jgi:hypothetical protein